MHIAIIASKKDAAGITIKESLIDEGFRDSEAATLHVIEEDSIHAEHLDRKVSADFFLFATRHSAKAEVKTLCVHPPGNWGEAKAGGKKATLSYTIPKFQKFILAELQRHNTLGWEVTSEATHHGPELERPCLFIEIGSTEREWENREAGAVIAKTAISFIQHANTASSNACNDDEMTAAVGLGGTHYCQAFNKINAMTHYAVGHVCPKHQLHLLRQAMEKSSAELVILDWKGLGAEKQRIAGLLEEQNIPHKRA